MKTPLCMNASTMPNLLLALAKCGPTLVIVAACSLAYADDSSATQRPVAATKPSTDPLDVLAAKLVLTPPVSNASATSARASNSDNIRQAQLRYGETLRATLQAEFQSAANAPTGLSAEVKITLLPDGSITDCAITRSSGVASFDQRVFNTVSRLHKALTPPQNLPYSAFRDIRIIFRE